MAAFISDEKFEIVDFKKAKSQVWNKFGLKRCRATGEVQEKVAVCKKCKMEVKYSGGTTNLNTHLERHHKIFKSESKETPSKVSVERDENRSTTSKRQLTLLECRSDKYSPSNPRAQAISHAIGKFIVQDLRPFSVVSNPGFKAMINVLDPRYEIPSRIFFSNNLIPRFYEDTKPRVMAILSEAPLVALTTDGWTSRATESYVTITGCAISKDWTLENVLLQTRALPESHTGSNIARVLLEALEEWHIPRTDGVPLVTDNAANMSVAAREAGLTPHIGCYAHTLNLAAQKSLKISSVARILGRVRKVVSFFHRSTTAAALLKSKTKLLGLKEVKLVQDVSTRWNSAVDMLERYLELQPAIFATLISKEVKQKESDVATLDDKDVELAEQIMKCLVPLRTITQALCSESMPTISVIRPIQIKLMTKVLKVRDDDPSLVKDMKSVMVKDLSSRYDNNLQFLDEASALDPRFKVTYLPQDEQFAVYSRLSLTAADLKTAQLKVEPETVTAVPAEAEPPLPTLPSAPGVLVDDSNQTSQILNEEMPATKTATTTVDEPRESKPKLTGLASILDDIVFVSEEKPTFTQFEKAVKEVDSYKQMDLLGVDSNPLEWWKAHEFELPLLARLAKRRLCIPATSVPSERVFSTAGDIVTAQRAAINPSVVDKLLFLKKNMK